MPATRYERHRPEATLLYSIMQRHLEGFLAEARERHGRGLPRYVETELRAYLACGIPAHGFLRTRCRSCGHELVVAFSCKRRGMCPSCNVRRMCNTAAHLVDRVIPDVPVRQWVLSVPFELRLLLARRADAFGALVRLFAAEVLRLQRLRARAGGATTAVGAGVSFPQRFGGSLNLNTHVHSVFLDGVFANGDRGGLKFIPLTAPDTGMLTLVCERVTERFDRWLRKKGLVSDDEDASALDSRDAMDACSQAAVGIGRLAAVPGEATDEPADDLGRSPKRPGRYVGAASGFHLHAAVSVPARNGLGRELLLRYCARPPLSLERLSLLPDGRVAYRIKKPWRPDQTHRVMQPREFLARLAALIPPPRTPLIRFHGAFGPHFRRRKEVVPAGHADRAGGNCPSAGGARDARAGSPSTPMRSQDSIHRKSGSDATLRQPAVSKTQEAPWRIDWATLLRRVYDIDALACLCGGRLRPLELVTEPVEARAILRRLGLSIEEVKTTPRRFIEPFDEEPPPDW